MDKSEERLWCLYYMPEDRMLRGLTKLEARAIATSLAHMEKIHWLAWKEKWEVWRSLPDVEELMEPLHRQITGPMPKVSEQQDIDDLEESDMNTLPTELMRKRVAERAAELQLNMELGEDEDSDPRIFEDPSELSKEERKRRKEDAESRRRRKADEKEQSRRASDGQAQRRSDDSRERRGGSQRGERRVEKYNPSTVENLGDITLDGQTALEEVDLEVLESSRVTGKEFKDFKARNFTRHRARLKVLILGPNGKSFESYTEDASVGGVRLTHSLPGWAIGDVQVKLINEKKKQAIEITCHVIEGQGSDNRRRLMILPLKKKNEEVQFDKWLEAA